MLFSYSATGAARATSRTITDTESNVAGSNAFGAIVTPEKARPMSNKSRPISALKTAPNSTTDPANVTFGEAAVGERLSQAFDASVPRNERETNVAFDASAVETENQNTKKRPNSASSTTDTPPTEPSQTDGTSNVEKETPQEQPQDCQTTRLQCVDIKTQAVEYVEVTCDSGTQDSASIPPAYPTLGSILDQDLPARGGRKQQKPRKLPHQTRVVSEHCSELALSSFLTNSKHAQVNNNGITIQGRRLGKSVRESCL